MKHDNNLSAGYFGVLFKPSNYRRLVDEIVEQIEKSKIAPDAIAFTGCSGGMIAPAVAAELDIYPLLIRKRNQSHSSMPVEGISPHVNNIKYVIIDDFISSGNTVISIFSTLVKYNPTWTLAAAFLYCPNFRFDISQISPHICPFFDIYYREKLWGGAEEFNSSVWSKG